MQKLTKGEVLKEINRKGYYDMDMMPTSGNFFLNRLSKSDYIERYKSWVYACTSTIASSVACLELVVKKENKVINSHNILNILDYELLEWVVTFLKLTGSAYLWKISTSKEVLDLKLLRPDRIKPVMDKKRLRVLSWEYTIDGKAATFTPEEIVVIKNFNPTLWYSGYGDVQAAAISIDTDNASSTWNRKFFENDANPGAVLSTEQKMSKEALERLEQKRNEKYSGVNNAKKLAILHGWLKYTAVSPSQKEMDFVGQRQFSRDEILAIFKVPKAMLGMGEGVNVGNVKAFSTIFARNVLLPLCTKLANTLTKQLLKDGYYLDFVNVVPADETETRSDWMAWGITLNEFREARGYPPVKWGDRFFLDDTNITLDDNVDDDIVEPGKNAIGSKLSDAVTKGILKSIPGTEEFYEEQRAQKIKRMDEYEKNYASKLKKIFSTQRNDVMQYIESLDDGKAYRLKAAAPKWNKTKYLTLYLSFMKSPQRELIQNEGELAIREVNSEVSFELVTPAFTKREVANIKKFSAAIDLYTADKVSKIFKNAEDNGISISQLKSEINNVFTDLTENRLETIVRTETIKLGTYAQEQARKQSGVVETKQRYTAIDDRVCPFCNEMHGKEITLGGNFFDKGDTLSVVDRDGKLQSVNLNYESIKGPPIHPKCRCTLIPKFKE